MSTISYVPRSLGAVQPFVQNNPLTIISQRNPTAQDKAPIGQEWINTTNNQAFILTSIVAGASTWTIITGGGSDTFVTLELTGIDPASTTLQVDQGNVIIQDGGLATNNGPVQFAAAPFITMTATGQITATSNSVAAGAISLDAADGGVLITGSTNISLDTGAEPIELNCTGNLQIQPQTGTSATDTFNFGSPVFVGVITFTGFTTAMGASQEFSIGNAAHGAGAGMLCTVQNLNASGNGALMTLTGIIGGAGDFVVATTNNGAGALGAGDDVIISFMIFA